MFTPTIYRTMTPNVDDVFGVRRDMDRWLDRLLVGPSQSLQPWAPAVDVKETENELAVSDDSSPPSPYSSRSCRTTFARRSPMAY